MTERPILFQSAMVRALLAGTKTQTRRIVKGEALQWLERDKFAPAFVADPENHLCPYGVPGDRLWVRETWAYHRHSMGSLCDDDGPWVYAADGEQALQYRLCDRWRPSIHMPRFACRLRLNVVNTRIERLQDISEDDARAEGAPGYEEGTDAPPPDGDHEWSYRASFQRLWESINGPESWAANPWVWVVQFKPAEPKQKELM